MDDCTSKAGKITHALSPVKLQKVKVGNCIENETTGEERGGVWSIAREDPSPSISRCVPNHPHSKKVMKHALRQQAKRRRKNTTIAAGNSAPLPRPILVPPQTELEEELESRVRPSTMMEVLNSIPGFTFKPRKRSNKKLSPAAQLEQLQAKEGSIDLETPDSILVQTNLRFLLNKHTFASLPPLYQCKLVQLLPHVDRTYHSDSSFRLSASGLNNEFFARALQQWRERLAEGEFTPENQQKLKLEAEKEKSKLDPWKLKHFEPIWGESNVATMQTSVVPTVVTSSEWTVPKSTLRASIKLHPPTARLRTVGAVTRAVSSYRGKREAEVDQVDQPKRSKSDVVQNQNSTEIVPHLLSKSEKSSTNFTESTPRDSLQQEVLNKPNEENILVDTTLMEINMVPEVKAQNIVTPDKSCPMEVEVSPDVTFIIPSEDVFNAPPLETTVLSDDPSESKQQDESFTSNEPSFDRSELECKSPLEETFSVVDNSMHTDTCGNLGDTIIVTCFESTTDESPPKSEVICLNSYTSNQITVELSNNESPSPSHQISSQSNDQDSEAKFESRPTSNISENQSPLADTSVSVEITENKTSVEDPPISTSITVESNSTEPCSNSNEKIVGEENIEEQVSEKDSTPVLVEKESEIAENISVSLISERVDSSNSEHSSCSDPVKTGLCPKQLVQETQGSAEEENTIRTSNFSSESRQFSSPPELIQSSVSPLNSCVTSKQETVMPKEINVYDSAIILEPTTLPEFELHNTDEANESPLDVEEEQRNSSPEEVLAVPSAGTDAVISEQINNTPEDITPTSVDFQENVSEDSSNVNKPNSEPSVHESQPSNSESSLKDKHVDSAKIKSESSSMNVDNSTSDNGFPGNEENRFPSGLDSLNENSKNESSGEAQNFSTSQSSPNASPCLNNNSNQMNPSDGFLSEQSHPVEESKDETVPAMWDAADSSTDKLFMDPAAEAIMQEGDVAVIPMQEELEVRLEESSLPAPTCEWSDFEKTDSSINIQNPPNSVPYSGHVKLELEVTLTPEVDSQVSSTVESSGAVIAPTTIVCLPSVAAPPLPPVPAAPTLQSAVSMVSSPALPYLALSTSTPVTAVRAVPAVPSKTLVKSASGPTRGSRNASNKPPPGAVNLERSYQICQAVIQNSPNRDQLRSQLKPPPSSLLNKEGVKTGMLTKGNRVGIQTTKTTRGHTAQPVLVKHVFTSSQGIPVTMAVLPPTNTSEMPDGGQYVLVQRGAGLSGVRRSSSAPPANNKLPVGSVIRGRPASVGIQAITRERFNGADSPVQNIYSQKQQSMDNCMCNLNAMVVCKKCGAFCHDDCISPSRLCLTCLIR